MGVCIGERCRCVIGARDLGRAIFMQHVSTLIMLVLPIDYFVLEVPTFVQDVPFLCFMHARSVRRIGSMDFEPFYPGLVPLFWLGRQTRMPANFWRGCPGFLVGSWGDMRGVTTTSCRRYRCFMQADLDGWDVLADSGRLVTFLTWDLMPHLSMFYAGLIGPFDWPFWV